VSEKRGEARIVTNYERYDDDDSLSLFTNSEGYIVD
jgi:hypothetical protein